MKGMTFKNYYMKYVFTFILLLAMGIGCKPKVLSGKALENKLMETMSDFLKNSPNKGIKFTVKDVIYYPNINKKLYDCEFHVDMQKGDKDTVGIMRATITNDFKDVERSQ